MFIQLKKAYFGKQPGERVDTDEAHARSLIEQGVAEALPDNHLTGLVEKQIGGMLEGLTRGVNETITKTLQEFAKAQTLSRKNAVPAIFGPGGEGDPKKNFGDWLLCVVAATTGTNGQKRIDAANRLEKDYGSMFNPWQKAALAESSGVAGGYIVPPDFYHQLLAIAAEESTFRQHAFVQPMASATLQFPYLDITTVQSAGVSPFFGGVQASWTAEAQTRTETEPQFKMMELKANELSGYTVSSNVLIQDAAFSLERFLMVLFGRAVSWFEEYAFLQGNGVGKPLGILNAPASYSLTRNTASHFYFADVSGMLAHLLPSSYTKARWYVSPGVVTDLLQLKDGANRAIFISIDQGVTKAPVWKLLNLPVTITEKLPALGTKGDVMLIDPSLYVIGDRMQLEIVPSEHANFLKNQMTWRFVQRVDGQPWMDKPVTLQDGVTQVSPFVVLN
jgi:HK97 family phage major capsid protein